MLFDNGKKVLLDIKGLLKQKASMRMLLLLLEIIMSYKELVFPKNQSF